MSKVCFSHRLKEIRKREKITQVQLSKRLKVTQGAVAQWETGVTMPSLELLPKLAEILDCTTDELLGIAKKP